MPAWLVILIILGVIGLAVPLILIGNKPKREQDRIKKQLYKKIYAFLGTNFITQKSMRKIYNKLATLSVFRKEELYSMSTTYLLISWGASGGLIILSIILFKDFISVLMCIALAFLLNTTLVDKQLDKQYFKVIQATSKALGSIRQEYMKNGSVVDAVNDAEIDDILKKPFDELSTILTATDAESRLQEFYESSPFRTLQTLVGICFNINNQGDTKASNGNSNFVEALTVLSTDVNAEITRITTQQKKFGFLEYLPFAPILAISVIEGYFQDIMPGTALIYGGPIGYISRTLIIIMAIVGYGVVSRINSTVPIKEDDRSTLALNLLLNEKWSKFIKDIKPKNKKRILWEQWLKMCLSRQTIDQIYSLKVVYGVLGFILTIIISISTLSMGKEFIRTSTQQLSLVATNEMEQFSQDTIVALDEKYVAERNKLKPEQTLALEVERLLLQIQSKLGLIEKQDFSTPDLPEAQVKGLVTAYMPGLTDLQVLDQQKRLADKYNIIENTEYKWFYVLFAFIGGFIGWKVPEWQLKLRRKMIKTEAEDDFLQLQTLVSILMTTDMDTLDTLYELSQHSRIHKEMLTYCYHSYPSNPELELTRLQSKTPLMEFKRFIGKLRLTISDLSLSEAFSDLKIEREQIMRIREITIMSTIDKKRSLCGPIAMAPLAIMVVGELLVPLGYLGYMEFMNALTMM